MTKYTPERQDIIWLDFDPSAGNEIKKRRPVLVISNSGYSELTNLTMVVPITHAYQNRLNKTDYLIPINSIPEIDGFINPLQIHTYDYKSRNAKKIDELDDSSFYKALRIIREIVD